MGNDQCPNCGARLRENAKFCDECGTQLNAEPTVRPSASAEQPVVSAQTHTASKNPIVIVIGVVIIVLLFGILCVRLVGGNAGGSADTTQYDNVNRQYATDVVIQWYSIQAGEKDNYNVYTPYVENGYIYIPIEAQINASNTVQYRGFGTASISDTFDKTVPFQYEYETSTVEKGVYQDLTLRIPITDLDVQRPTTLYCQLSVFVAGQQQRINLEFDISW